MSRSRKRKSQAQGSRGRTGWSRRDFIQTVISAGGAIGTWWSIIWRTPSSTPTPTASAPQLAPEPTIKQIVARDTVAVNVHETFSLQEHVQVKVIQAQLGRN